MVDRWLDRGKTLLRRARTRLRTAERSPPDRWHLQHPGECQDYLIARAAYLAKRAGSRNILAVAHAPAATDPVVTGLRRQGLRVECMSTGQVAQGARPAESPCTIVCLDLDSPAIAAAARACLRHPGLREAPFEYATAVAQEYATLVRHDDPHYSTTYFHSPLLLEPLAPFKLYEQSLARFEKKCDIRDYMDLFQVIREIVRLDVPGDVAEFGSLQGHSGYLIATTLAAAGSRKHVYLFDTFKTFPVEAEGIDQFWSNTCAVDFEEVKARFASVPNVTLVQGEFTQTLPQGPQTPLALAHVDCDSHRGIRYVTQQIYARVSPGGFIVFEDYGHPALLGARLAVEEFVDAHPECTRWFSQFSGLYVVQKPR